MSQPPNLAAAATAAFSLVARTGLPVNTGVKALVVVLIAAVTLAISVWGHAAIDFVVVRHTDFGRVPDRPLTCTALGATLPAGVALIASGPLSYTTGAPARAVAGLDGVRRLPVRRPGLRHRHVRRDRRRHEPIRLSLSVLVDGTVSVALTLYALLVSDFPDTVGTVLQLTVVLLGPSTAVYATDILLRRNRYVGLALGDESRTRPFWYTGGFNRSGVLALGAGAGASAVCVDTVYTGLVAAPWAVSTWPCRRV
ncbi:hypothetical protein ACFV2N_06375 [Streptomyces sp. NPDC059680]|uniref:hypothetical protein n=1 Tax=Streptomyces sp. NPDC059680 TaxID=3346904 RepID=UPI0036AD3735